MVTIRPLQGLRPREDLISKIASLPYDVLTTEEARAIASNNPYSYLHVIKSEIDLCADAPKDAIFEKALENFTNLKKNHLVRDNKPCLYIYKQTLGDHTQVGILGCFATNDYTNRKIKKHEQTRIDKEMERTKHIETLKAQTGLVMLTYKQKPTIDRFVSDVMNSEEPIYDFILEGFEDKTRQIIWRVEDEKMISRVKDMFSDVESLYIVDGHHRSAASVRYASVNPNNEEAQYFVAVAIPDNQLNVLPYNRVVKGDVSNLLTKLKECFDIQTADKFIEPSREHEFMAFFNKKWHKLTYKLPLKGDIKEDLDVSILQDCVLDRIFDIKNPRKDDRIDFIGGIKGYEYIEDKVNKGGYNVGFYLYPTKVSTVMNVADKEETMPPKSTWFEPKLLSGLIVHTLEG